MKPISTISSTGTKNFPSNIESISNVSTEMCSIEPQKKKLKQTPAVDKVILAIEQSRTLNEESKERRHEEKLEQKREALDLLSR